MHDRRSDAIRSPAVGRGERTRGLGAVAATGLLTLVLLLAPTASAEKFHGEMAGAKAVKLLTNQDDELRLIFFKHWTAKCNAGGKFRWSSGFRQPVKRSSKRSFYDSDTLAPRADGVLYRVSGKVRGRRVSDQRWTGIYKASIVIKVNGERVNRCRTPSLRWTVNRAKR